MRMELLQQVQLRHRQRVSLTDMQGKIIKGIAGFYYVHCAHGKIYECKAKGIFRYKNIKPLVGDNVELDIISESEATGNITKILERKNSLIRPEVANIDQALILFAVKSPSPNLNLLDRLLVMMEVQQIPCMIAFGKADLVQEEEIKPLQEIYQQAGYPCIGISTFENRNIDNIKELLFHKTTALAGPSGVGKSTLLNYLVPHANMETGSISTKIERGKHTTRHSELFDIDETTYICDTPGFSSMYIRDFEADSLKHYFPEFEPYFGMCKFGSCNHIREPGCSVKEALSQHKISKSRYENYILMYNELKNNNKK